jgi:hypothetical protein
VKEEVKEGKGSEGGVKEGEGREGGGEGDKDVLDSKDSKDV